MIGQSMASFATLPLSAPMLDNLRALEYKYMTDVQAESIPLIIDGWDVLAEAKTGSGKTAAFGIGLLHNMNLDRYRVQSLIICPTRELAVQVTDELRRLARFQHNIKIVTITGGVPQYKQEDSLRHQAHIVVGTPGRVLALLEKGTISLKELKSIVLDEADRMLEMGFIDQIKAIMKFAPAKKQTLFFSATFPKNVKEFALSILQKPQEVKVEVRHDTSVIKQEFFSIHPSKRGAAVVEILAKYNPESTIVFCNTKDACRAVERSLNARGVHALALHGDLDQKVRTEVLVRFANKSSRVLVATDVAARGLDIDELSCVINCDLPSDAETYVHRIGRTGRAGKEGLAFSLVTEEEEYLVLPISRAQNTEFFVNDPEFTYKDNHPELTPPMITVSINGGRKQKVSAGDILGALTASGKIPGNSIGKIDRQDFITFVAVERAYAETAFELLENAPIKGMKFLARFHD